MDKQIFNESAAKAETSDAFQPKREFDGAEVSIDPEALNGETLESELLTGKFDQIVRPQPRWWKPLLAGAVFLFLAATAAQSVQWLLDTWAANQWIYFAFALVGLIAVLLGGSAIIKEWRRLVKLKKRMRLQQQSTVLWRESAVGLAADLSAQSSERGTELCLNIAAGMGIDGQNPDLNRWRQQISEGHSAAEVAYLFSRNVIHPFDLQAKKLISKNAAEAAVIVAISPLALVDMFFIAWRNIRLINRIAGIYGIELGYLSRLRLLRMVLLNVAFAGASELVQDIGMDWLSQDLTARLSARAAQGIGVGLLTARLGIKAMEFCRPLTFRHNEKPRLSSIHKELLSSLKSTVLTGAKSRESKKL